MEPYFFMDDPEHQLEKVYIAEYLKRKGYTLHDISVMAEAEAKRLMTEASTYAATKLSEVENRARMVQEIHGASDQVELG